MRFRNTQGFTLIELMIVVVIIGILAAIAIPNYYSMQQRAAENEVKGNAHAAQLYVEDEAIKANGVYPDGIADHLNGLGNIVNRFGNVAFVDVPSDEKPGDEPGVCYYERSGVPSAGYRITVNGKDGIPILELSNTN